MPVYLVLPTKRRDEILALANKAGVDVLSDPFKQGGFLASFAGTPRELGAVIGIHEENPIGEGIIVPMSAYHGWANTQIWTWIKSRQERSVE